MVSDQPPGRGDPQPTAGDASPRLPEEFKRSVDELITGLRSDMDLLRQSGRADLRQIITECESIIEGIGAHVR